MRQLTQKKAGVFIVLLWWSTIACAQNYHFKHYGVEDGLAQSSVNHFTQDRFGYLWIATAGGVSRFDGQDFVSYGLPEGLASNYVNQLLETKSRQLAFATYDGLSLYDGTAFQNFQAISQQGKPLEVSRIFEHRDGRLLLLAGANNLAYYAQDTISFLRLPSHLKDQYFSGMEQDRSGNYWISTYEGELLRYDGQSFTTVFAAAKEHPHISSIYIDTADKLWLITKNKGLCIYDTTKNEVVPYLFDQEMTDAIFTIAQDATGYFWVGTNNGVFRFDPKNGRIDPKSYGLWGTIVRNIFVDREDNVWFGTLDEGVFQFRGDMFTQLRREDGLHDKTIMSLSRDHQGHYWFGTLSGGVDQYDGKQIVHYGEEEGLTSHYVSTMVSDSAGHLWLGTNAGIRRYDGKNFQQIPSVGLPSPRVVTSLLDRQQRLWFGTRAGPVYYDDDTFVRISDQSGRPFGAAVNVMHELADGRMIFGTQHGMYIQDPQGVRPLANQSESRNAAILAVTQDAAGKVWYATINGLVCQYDLQTKNLIQHDTAGHFPQSVVYSMETAFDGSLILGTQRGILRLVLNEQGEVVRYVNYGKDDGFLGVEANMNATYQDTDGSIWLGTVDGVFRFRPDTIQHDPHYTVSPHLTGIKLYYEEVDWQCLGSKIDPWFGIPETLNLSHPQNHLVFSFQAISLMSAQKVRYQFMLENFDEGWSPVTDRSEAVYANIPPGQYTFRIRARNAQGFWSEATRRLSVTIAPPFWQTWWFYLLLAFFGILLIRIYTWWKLRNERRQRLVLEQEVDKRTEEIRSLNENLEGRVQERTSALEQSKQRLVHQEKEYRVLVNNLREIIFKTDINGRFTFLNHRWEEYTGYSIEESLHQHFLRIVHPDEHDGQRYQFHQMLLQKIPYIDVELRLVKKDQTITWGKVSARLEYDDEGNVKGTTGSLMDIDRRIQMEFALKASEEKYRFLAENTQEIITLQDCDLRYTYVSPRIGEVADLDPKSMIGHTSFDYIHPDDRPIYEAFQTDLDSQKSMDGVTIRFQNKQGEYRYYEVFLKPIFNEHQQFVSYISSSRDVTHKVKLTREIEEVRKKVAQDFHDEMGNHLASISVLSQIIQKKLGTQENNVGSLLTKIDTASKNLFYGTRDFIWAIDPRNDDLREVYFNLKDFGEELFENTGVTFLASFKPCEEQDTWKIPSGWSRQMVLLFKEALTNALKYAQADTVRLTFEVCDTTFRATLADNGVGFDLDRENAIYRGINNMKERAHKIRANFALDTELHQGTCVCLHGKITQTGGILSDTKYTKTTLVE